MRVENIALWDFSFIIGMCFDKVTSVLLNDYQQHFLAGEEAF
jgi:hypothetical protein